MHLKDLPLIRGPDPKTLRGQAPFKLMDLENLRQAQNTTITNMGIIHDAINNESDVNTLDALNLKLQDFERFEGQLEAVIKLATDDLAHTFGDVTAPNPVNPNKTPIKFLTPLTASNPPSRTSVGRPLAPNLANVTSPSALREFRRKQREEEERLDREEELREQLLQSREHPRQPLEPQQASHPTGVPQTLEQFNIEARRSREKILRDAGVNMSDLQFRKMLQLNATGSPDPDDDNPPLSPYESPPQSPTKTLRSGREIDTSLPPKKRGRATKEQAAPTSAAKRAKTPRPPTATTVNDIIPETPAPERDDPLASALLKLNESVTIQTRMMMDYFQKPTHPEPPQFTIPDDYQFVTPAANGTEYPPLQDSRQSLWPHVDNTLLQHIKNANLPVDKLHLLIPVDDRAVVPEKPELTIARDGSLNLNPATSDTTKMTKQFPTFGSFLRAFTTWAAIKQTYDNYDPFYAAALIMHITKMITLNANTTWNNVLRYELSFFRHHQASKSIDLWSNLDTRLFLSAGLTKSDNVSPDKKRTPCFRYNRPTQPGQKSCNPSNCIYGHFCSNDGCKGSHPAFACPHRSFDPRPPRNNDRNRDGYQDRSYRPHNPNTTPLQSRISRE